MTKIFYCSECPTPREIKGIFAFLYYAGKGQEINHLNVRESFYPPNSLVCRKHIEYLPEELFVLPPEWIKKMDELQILGLMQGDGYQDRDGFTISTLWSPSILTLDGARKTFPGAVRNIERQLMEGLESKIEADYPSGISHLN